VFVLSTRAFSIAFTVTGVSLTFLSGCGTSVHAPDAATKNAANAQLSKNLVGSGKSGTDKKDGMVCDESSIPSSKVDAVPGSNFSPESPDMKAESDVDEKVLTAWRLAVKNDEKKSLEMIDALDKKYPKFKTVAAMHAQILDHFGRKKEALKYYEEATSGNDFDLLHTFKMARAYRTAGDTKMAIEKYRKLVKEAPDFPPGKFGLAQALISEDKNSAEARELLGRLNADDRATLEAEEAAANGKAKASNTSSSKEVKPSK
jgi:tetratricopeptide (TPR) repeat protein